MTAIVRWWWIRHAPSEGDQGIVHGQDDVAADLSNQDAVAATAAKLPENAVWLTSTIRRAKETAQALRPGVESIEIKALDEQNYGIWNGQSWNDLKGEDAEAFWKDFANNKPPEGESYVEQYARVSNAILELNPEYPDRDVIAVVHAGTIRSAIGLALDLAPMKALSVQVGNLSITRINAIPMDDGLKWAVHAVNLLPE